MKKSIAAITVLVFLLGFAAAAFAIEADIPATTPVVALGSTHIQLSGSLRIRGWYLGHQNGTTTTGNVTIPANNTDGTYWDTRVRLNLDMSSGPVSGRIGLESGNSRSSTWKWGSEGTVDTKPSSTNSTVTFREAWINYSGSGLLGVPAGFKIGHQPLALGPANIFFDNTKFGDDALVLYANPTPKTTAMFLTFKAAEGDFYNNGSDLDGYVGVFDGSFFGGQTLGIDYTYLHLDNGGPTIAAPARNFAAVLPGGLSFSNLEAFGAGKVSGIGYMAQLDYQFGNVAHGYQAGGWGVWLGLNKAISSSKARFAFGYGSGPSDSEEADTSNKQSQLITFLNPHAQYFTLVYGYTLEDAGAINAQANGNGGSDDGLANTLLLNAGIDLKPTPKLGASADLYYLHANNALSGKSKNIGEEVDLKGTYAITKNLKYFAQAGVLFAGAFYSDNFTGAVGGSPWTLMHGVQYTF